MERYILKECTFCWVSSSTIEIEVRRWAELVSATKAHTYSGLITFAVLVLLLCCVLAAIAYLFSLTAAQDTEKRSEYECGFAPFDSATRHPFEVHFYVVGILFLIFDVEIALLFPWVLTVEAIGVFSYLMMFQFIYILAVGFHYEWKRGALIWPARYAPSRLTVASAKWFSLMLLVLVADLPVEALLFAPLTNATVLRIARLLSWLSTPLSQSFKSRFLRSPQSPVEKRDPDAGANFKEIETFTYTPLYGPHPENSPHYVYLAACEEARKPVFGPLTLGVQHPRIEEHKDFEIHRRARAWHKHEFLQDTALLAFFAAYLGKWYTRRGWWRPNRYRYLDPYRGLAISVSTSVWKRLLLYVVTFVCMFLLLLIMVTVWEACPIAIYKGGMAPFFELQARANAYFVSYLPDFARLSQTMQLTISTLLIYPSFAIVCAATHWLFLCIAALVYTRLFYLCSYRGWGSNLRWQEHVADLLEQERKESFAFVIKHAFISWHRIYSKFHPDKGARDQQHDEYVSFTGAEDRKHPGREQKINYFTLTDMRGVARERDGIRYDDPNEPSIWAAAYKPAPKKKARTFSEIFFDSYQFLVFACVLPGLGNVGYLLSVLTTAANYGVELLTALLPELTLLAMLVYLIKIVGIELGRGRSKKALAIETLGAVKEALGFIVWLYLLQVQFVEITPVLSGYFFWAVGITVSKLFVATTCFFLAGASENFVRRNVRHLLEYPIMLLLAILLLLCLVGANNLMTMFLCIGGFSVSLYVLILFDVYARVTREAAVKYFYLSAMSAGLIVFGTFLLYSATGTAMFSDLRWALLTYDNVNPVTSSTGLAFILLGLFFKLSAFPAHLWAVEVYEGSPTPVMAFFLLPVKMAVLLVFIRLLSTAFIGLSHFWLPCVAIVCAGSLLWGAFAALYERKISRFLGYASINQLGYLLMGAACDTDDALRSTYIYLLLYVMMSGGFLFVYMHTFRKGRLNLLYISDFRGFAVQERALGWSLTVFLFSSVGIPPLVGFHAKYIVLVAAMQKELFFLAIVGIGVGLLSAYYYLQFVASFQFEEQNRAVPTRCLLSQDERFAVTVAEATLWIAPFLGPTVLPVFQTIAEAALTPGSLPSELPCTLITLVILWWTAVYSCGIIDHKGVFFWPVVFLAGVFASYLGWRLASEACDFFATLSSLPFLILCMCTHAWRYCFRRPFVWLRRAPISFSFYVGIALPCVIYCGYASFTLITPYLSGEQLRMFTDIWTTVICPLWGRLSGVLSIYTRYTPALLFLAGLTAWGSVWVFFKNPRADGVVLIPMFIVEYLLGVELSAADCTLSAAVSILFLAAIGAYAVLRHDGYRLFSTWFARNTSVASLSMYATVVIGFCVGCCYALSFITAVFILFLFATLGLRRRAVLAFIQRRWYMTLYICTVLRDDCYHRVSSWLSHHRARVDSLRDFVVLVAAFFVGYYGYKLVKLIALFFLLALLLPEWLPLSALWEISRLLLGPAAFFAFDLSLFAVVVIVATLWLRRCAVLAFIQRRWYMTLYICTVLRDDYYHRVSTWLSHHRTRVDSLCTFAALAVLTAWLFFRGGCAVIGDPLPLPTPCTVVVQTLTTLMAVGTTWLFFKNPATNWFVFFPFIAATNYFGQWYFAESCTFATLVLLLALLGIYLEQWHDGSRRFSLWFVRHSTRITALGTFAALVVFAVWLFTQGGSAAISFSALLSLAPIALALAVILFRNPMHSLLALIGVFLLAVLIYILSGAEFLGLVFLIVYVGAVAILFLFVIMLLNVKSLISSASLIQDALQVFLLDAGVSLGLLLHSFNSHALFLQSLHDIALYILNASTVEALLYYVNYGAADVMAFATLYSDQAALFLLITVILLIAMLGAIVLATATLDEEEPLARAGD